MKKRQTRIPELLAPAGSLESFNAALEAGADAVYLGVGALNARLRARNFTMDSLAQLLGRAKSSQVKIYVTLNTLVKQDELKSVLDMLYQLQQLEVDAVIVQDLGLADLAHRYFPALTLHASTQMVIHNQMGLDAMDQLGIKRAVLSRELSFPEIERLQLNAPVELEVFIHGALCYAISGLCLASSFIGGWSGNRGRCTQVCRRKFSSQQDEGYSFSPGDLWAVDHIADFSRIGISSLKIEGRMKRAEYVYTVVTAYRKLLDGKASVAETKAELSLDLGRGKTDFFLSSPDKNVVIESGHSPGTGLPVGTLESLSEKSLQVRTELVIRPGDTLRLQDSNGDERTVFTVEQTSTQKGLTEIIAQDRPVGNVDDQLYLISRKLNRSHHWSQNKADASPKGYQKRYPNHQRVLNSLNRQESPGTRADSLFLKINDPGWLPILKSFDCDYLIVAGSRSFHADLLSNPRQLTYWKNRLIIEFPPFIAETELAAYQQLVSEYSRLGVQRWMCAHFSQAGLFPRGDMRVADSMVWTTNRASQNFLLTSGYDHFTYSLEDDLLNIKASASGSGIMPILGHVPLFISKIQPASRSSRIVAGKGQGFLILEKEGLFYTISEQLVCLFHRREKLRGFGINRFLLDFSFMEPSRKHFKTIAFQFSAGQKLTGASIFNHKAGLK
ncbi:MAG: peptidase U32 family protein [bacterium]